MQSLENRINKLEERNMRKNGRKRWACVQTFDGKDYERLKQDKLKELGGKEEDYDWKHIRFVSPKGDLNNA